MRDDSRLALFDEVRALEQEIRSNLRTSSSLAGLSAAVFALAFGVSASDLNEVAYSVLPILLSVVALSYINSSIEVSALSTQRDWLTQMANREAQADVFLSSFAARARPNRITSFGVNLLAAGILTGTWVAGLTAAHDQWWFFLLLAAGIVIGILGGISLWELRQTPYRVRSAIETGVRVQQQ